jgi:hypothetical protein
MATTIPRPGTRQLRRFSLRQTYAKLKAQVEVYSAAAAIDHKCLKVNVTVVTFYLTILIVKYNLSVYWESLAEPELPLTNLRFYLQQLAL